MASLRAVFVSAIWLGSAFGQITFSSGVPATSAARQEVAGVVINAATGEPLRKALVTLQTAEGQNAAFSDASGHFALENVPEGTYQLQCQKPGYFGRMGPQFQQTKVSSTPETVTIKLMPAASIAGRVVDNEGQPVEAATIQLLSENIVNGRRLWQPNQSGSTDEDGSYEISNLPVGTYRLRLNMVAAPSFAVGSQTAQSRLPLDVYPAQYFPQGTDPSNAQALLLQGGRTERADFTVTAVPGFRVRGLAVPSKAGLFLRVEDAAGNDVGVGAATNGPSGRFVIAGVPAGAWRIIGQSFGSEEQLWGEHSIEVNGADISNLSVHLEPLPNIPVEFQNAPEGGVPGLQLRLVRDDASMDGAAWRQPDYRAVSANGPADAQKGPEFHFPDVHPGHYLLRAQIFGATNCLDSVRSGNADVERNGLDVAAGQPSQPLQVSFRSDCASVEVKVNLPEETPMASVLIVPENPLFEPQTTGLGGLGSVQFSNLSPGKYRIYAFDNTENLAYANPEALSAFEAKELTLDPNQKAQLTLDVIKRPAEPGAVNATQ